MFKKSMAACVAVAFGLLSPGVMATAYSLQANGQWVAFDVDDMFSQSGGLEWIDAQSAAGFNNDGSPLTFTFTLTGSAVLSVVDGGFAGDVFQVYNHGALLGGTSAATDSYPNGVSTNFDAAWTDSIYSQASFLLGAGSYSITGKLLSSALDDNGAPIDATVGAVRLTQVPSPAPLGLILAGIGLLSAFKPCRSSGSRG